MFFNQMNSSKIVPSCTFGNIVIVRNLFRTLNHPLKNSGGPTDSVTKGLWPGLTVSLADIRVHETRCYEKIQLSPLSYHCPQQLILTSYHRPQQLILTSYHRPRQL